MEVVYLNDPASEHIYLKTLEAEDAEDYFKSVDASREHLSQFGDNTAAKYMNVESVEDSLERLQNFSKLRFGIWDIDFGFVGSINATPNGKEVELGYWTREDSTGQGHATLAVNALVTYLKPRYSRIFAEVAADNKASRRVLEKSGFCQTAQKDALLIYDYANEQIPGQQELFDPLDL